MSRYVLSSEALAELDDIWGYIAQDDIEAADGWIAKLLDACELLARNPQAGHTRNDLTESSFLFWPVGKYFIIYRVLEDVIEVVAITQGARHSLVFAPPPLITTTFPAVILACYGHNWLWHRNRDAVPGRWIDR